MDFLWDLARFVRCKLDALLSKVLSYMKSVFAFQESIIKKLFFCWSTKSRRIIYLEKLCCKTYVWIQISFCKFKFDILTFNFGFSTLWTFILNIIWLNWTELKSIKNILRSTLHLEQSSKTFKAKLRTSVYPFFISVT